MRPIETHTAREIRSALEDARIEYQRYGQLIDLQLQAVEQGDLEEVARLGKERGVVGRQIERLLLPTDREALVRQDPQSQVLIIQMRRKLQQVAEADRKLRARLTHLRNKTLEELRELDSRSGQLRNYLSEHQDKGNVDFRL